MKPKLAFCFRGICKNFDPLWNNYKEKIIDPLLSVYDIDFYLSTNKISKYISSRSGENNEARWDSILPYFNFAKSIILEEDDIIFAEILNFSNNLVDTYGGNWGGTPNGWSDEQSKQNTFFAMKNLYSIYLLSKIVPKTYDKYLITRQDMIFFDTIDINLVANAIEDAIIPSYFSWGGYCDRFAILNTKAFDIYINRYNTIKQNPQKYHEENYLKFNCLDKHNITIKKIDNFKFDTLRLTNHKYTYPLHEKICIVRSTYYDRSAFLQLSLEYQKQAQQSSKYKTYIFIDPHDKYGYTKDYNKIITDKYYRINWETNAGKLSWYNSIKYIFDNTNYDYIISIEDDVLISKDYLRLCEQLALHDGALVKDDNILYFHIGAWEKPKGNPNKIVRSRSSIRSAMIYRDKFYKYIDKFYKLDNKNIKGLDLDLQHILEYNNMTTICPEMNRHAHIGIYGWSSTNISEDTRGQSSIFDKYISHEELYELLKKSCLSGDILLELNKNNNPNYFWDFDPNINFTKLEYSL